jgi:hypothetical protein
MKNATSELAINQAPEGRVFRPSVWKRMLLTSAFLFSFSPIVNATGNKPPTVVNKVTSERIEKPSRSISMWQRLLDAVEQKAERNARRKASSQLYDRMDEITRKYSQAMKLNAVTIKHNSNFDAKDKEIARLKARVKELRDGYRAEIDDLKLRQADLEDTVELFVEGRRCNTTDCKHSKLNQLRQKLKESEKKEIRKKDKKN